MSDHDVSGQEEQLVHPEQPAPPVRPEQPADGPWLTRPSPFTVAFGLLVLALAVLAVLKLTGDVRVDYGVAVPIAWVVTGVVLLGAGLASLLMRTRD